MSYNNLVNNITQINTKVSKVEAESNFIPKNILSREEKLDAFLESTVVDKYKQKWKDLTTFLRTNRIKLFINEQETLTDIEKESLIRKLSNMLNTGKLKNADFNYNCDEGKIESIKGFL